MTSIPLSVPGLAAGLRTPEERDVPAIARHADDHEVWRQLRDSMPHPYTVEHASAFVSAVTADHLPVLAITVGDESVGMVGLTPGEDVHRRSAEIGYWLGRAWWGRGLVTAALAAVTARALSTMGLLRVFALPHADNRGSRRVLEKCGYALEGINRLAVVKNGRVLDQAVYARVNEGAT